MVKNKILVTRPKHDNTTYYLFNWSEEVIKLAEDKGFGVLKLDSENANKTKFESMLKKEPKFIFFNGHGNYDCVSGHDNKEIVKSKVNCHKLKSSIVYALSCKSAKTLGKTAVENGTFAYIGYSDDFTFYTNENYASRPLTDPLANAFKEASNAIPLSLLKGHTVSEAIEKSKKIFDRWISYFRSSDAPINSVGMIRTLMWDKHILTLHGNNTTKIE